MLGVTPAWVSGTQELDCSGQRGSGPQSNLGLLRIALPATMPGQTEAGQRWRLAAYNGFTPRSACRQSTSALRCASTLIFQQEALGLIRCKQAIRRGALADWEQIKFRQPALPLPFLVWNARLPTSQPVRHLPWVERHPGGWVGHARNTNSAVVKSLATLRRLMRRIVFGPSFSALLMRCPAVQAGRRKTGTSMKHAPVITPFDGATLELVGYIGGMEGRYCPGWAAWGSASRCYSLAYWFNFAEYGS